MKSERGAATVAAPFLLGFRRFSADQCPDRGCFPHRLFAIDVDLSRCRPLDLRRGSGWSSSFAGSADCPTTKDTPTSQLGDRAVFLAVAQFRRSNFDHGSCTPPLGDRGDWCIAMTC
jgi:hypothetical protein